MSHVISLTTEVEATVQRLRELWSHLHDQVLRFLEAVFALLHCVGDHSLESNLVESVHYIANPLAIDMHPVTLVRQVLENRDFATRKFKDVLDGEPLDLRHGGDHGLLTLDVL